MAEFVVLDAVSVATIARAARDLCAGIAEDGAASALLMLPDHVAGQVQRLLLPALPAPAGDALLRYADELDEIAEAAVELDQHDHEIEHQLRWWDERARVLEGQLSGHPGDDVDIVRELALFRGRISGAHTMRRHYVQQRSALAERHVRADQVCATGLAAL